MAKVKCRFCNKLIERDEAYKVKHGRANWYYCNEEHSMSKTPREKFYDVAYNIFGKTTNTIFFKEMDDIANIHGYEKMKSYLEDNSSYLENVMQKNFSSEYARCRYFSAILKNNLGDYVVKKPDVVKKIEIEVYEPLNNKKKQRNKRKGLDEIMEGFLNG